MIEQFCQHCERYLDEDDKMVVIRLENIRMYRAAFPNIQKGVLCMSCDNKWRIKIKEPRMGLDKLFCGICHKEEPTATFKRNFKRIDGRLLPTYKKITRKENVILGPMCTNCESFLNGDEETSDDLMEFDSNVNLSINFPEDEFFKMPNISKISK
jgi:hypothetical protein